MIITCPKCSTKNRISDVSEPGKRYSCGKCKSRLTPTPEAPDTQDERSVILQSATEDENKKVTRIAGIVFLCLTLVGLATLAGWAIADKISVSSKEGLEIVMSPSGVLREIAQPVEEIGKKERQLAALMINTMEKADGTGLAAPQVGVSKRIIVVKLDRPASQEGILVMVNPEITKQEGSASGTEVELSLPRTETVEVTRSKEITVKYRSLEGEEVVLSEKGWNARVIQHGIDHLDGGLISDYARPFNITPEVLVAISILVVFLFIEMKYSFD